MKYLVLISALLVPALPLQAKSKGDTAKAKPTPDSIFKKLDKNGDGNVSLQEFSHLGDNSHEKSKAKTPAKAEKPAHKAKTSKAKPTHKTHHSKGKKAHKGHKAKHGHKAHKAHDAKGKKSHKGHGAKGKKAHKGHKAKKDQKGHKA